jgi:hypothetical protein
MRISISNGHAAGPTSCARTLAPSSPLFKLFPAALLGGNNTPNPHFMPVFLRFSAFFNQLEKLPTRPPSACPLSDPTLTPPNNHYSGRPFQRASFRPQENRATNLRNVNFSFVSPCNNQLEPPSPRVRHPTRRTRSVSRENAFFPFCAPEPLLLPSRSLKFKLRRESRNRGQ